MTSHRCKPHSIGSLLNMSWKELSEMTEESRDGEILIEVKGMK